MTDETNQSVIEDVAQPAESEQHNDVSENVQEAQASKRNDAEHNWAEMRRMRDRDREEIEALRNELNKLKPQPAPQEEDYGFKDDDLIEGRHLKDLKKEIRALKSELKFRDESTLEERLQVRFPDYQEVLSRENIEILNKTEPELVESLSHMPDPYKKAVAAYKLLKKVADQKGEPSGLERKKLAENSKKPVSVQAVTKTSAIGDAHIFENGLTPDLKKALLKEMEMARKSG